MSTPNCDILLCPRVGYRPILDAMKSFACDAKSCTDIEVCRMNYNNNILKINNKVLFFWQDIGSKSCSKKRRVCSNGHSLCWGLKKAESDPSWYSPTSLSELAAIFTAHSNSSFRLLAGDTGRGVGPFVLGATFCTM